MNDAAREALRSREHTARAASILNQPDDYVVEDHLTTPGLSYRVMNKQANQSQEDYSEDDDYEKDSFE